MHSQEFDHVLEKKSAKLTNSAQAEHFYQIVGINHATDEIETIVKLVVYRSNSSSYALLVMHCENEHFNHCVKVVGGDMSLHYEACSQLFYDFYPETFDYCGGYSDVKKYLTEIAQQGGNHYSLTFLEVAL